MQSAWVSISAEESGIYTGCFSLLLSFQREFLRHSLLLYDF